MTTASSLESVRYADGAKLLSEFVLPLERMRLVYRPEIVGSAYIHGEGADLDVVCLANHFPTVTQLHRNILTEGWDECGEYGPEGDLAAYRRGPVNLIVCKHEQYYEDWIKAARVCKFLADRGMLRPEDKPMRALVHRIVMDDWTPEMAHERLVTLALAAPQNPPEHDALLGCATPTNCAGRPLPLVPPAYRPEDQGGGSH